MHYVFFFPDEQRAKSLSCYGNKYIQTPNYDRLAREGVLFEQNYTTHPVCVASRCSLMTGWYPHVAGFRTLKYFIPSWQPNFLRYIHDAGFETHVYGKNHMFTEDTYFECIDKYLYVDFGHGGGKHYEGNVPMAKKIDTSSSMSGGGKKGGGMPACTDYTMLLPAMPDDELETMGDTNCTMAAIDAIKGWKEGDKPLFIFIPTFFPHAPYSIVEHYYNLLSDEELPPVLPWDLEGKPEFMALIRKYRELGATDEKIYRKIHAVYLGMTAYSDMLLGRILDALDETGLANDTTVIASSDHGDWAGDYGLVEKWPNGMDDDLTRVPLIIRRPGCKAGHRVKELTQTFDIFPTICDWEGIQIKHDQFGVSLKDQVAGAPGDPSRVVYCEGGYDAREPHCFEGTAAYAWINKPGNIYYPKMIQQQKDPESVCRTVMMRDTQYKLCIRTSGDNELYDMLADPDELKNLYHDEAYQPLIHKMQAGMLNFMIHTSDVVPWEGHL